MKFLITLAVFVGTLSANSFAATMCNAGGADPLDCKSADGKFEILVHPRFYWGDVSQNGFCDTGYIKIRGVELNGSVESGEPAAAGLEVTQSTTSSSGLNVTINQSKKVVTVSTVIDFQFGDVAARLLNDTHLNWGQVLVAKDEKTAVLYMIDDQDHQASTPMTCGL